MPPFVPDHPTASADGVDGDSVWGSGARAAQQHALSLRLHSRRVQHKRRARVEANEAILHSHQG